MPADVHDISMSRGELFGMLPAEVRASWRLGTFDEFALVLRHASPKPPRLRLASRVGPLMGQPAFQLRRPLGAFPRDYPHETNDTVLAWVAAQYFGVPAVVVPTMLVCGATIVHQKGHVVQAASTKARVALWPHDGVPVDDDELVRWRMRGDDDLRYWPTGEERSVYWSAAPVPPVLDTAKQYEGRWFVKNPNDPNDDEYIRVAMNTDGRTIRRGVQGPTG